jgi:streptogramin lyase
MDRYGSANLNRQLGDWLREESTSRAPARLVEEVFARTSRTGQVRRWWPQLPRRNHSIALVPPPLAGFAGVAAFAVVFGLVVTVLLQPRALEPGGSPGSSSPAPSASASPGLETPRAMDLGGSPAQVVSLWAGAGPIDVVSAFGSIWTANSLSNDVGRFDPTTMRLLARIPAGTGPTWFVEAGGALWVTNQTGKGGLVRIDPETERASAPVGAETACGRPVLALGSLWAPACEADVIMRIDPATAELVDTIPAAGHKRLVLAGPTLVASGPAGLARFDPTTGTFFDIGACCGALIGSDGQTVWTSDETKVERIDPTDGRVVATFPYRYARGLGFGPGRAWLTVSNTGVVEIDLATNEVTRTIPQWPDPTVPLEAVGALWVTSLPDNELWRIVP